MRGVEALKHVEPFIAAGATARSLGTPPSASSRSANAPHASAIESWTLTLAAVEAWLADAKQGDTLTYAHGPTLVRGAAAEHLRRLESDGEVVLCQKRSGAGFDYRAIRNRVRVVTQRSERLAPAGLLTPLMRDLLVLIEAAARQGKRCPSNSDLAKGLGVPEEGAKWHLRKLASAGIIRTRIVPAPGEPKFRIVEIVGSGLQTASPDALGLAPHTNPAAPSARGPAR